MRILVIDDDPSTLDIFALLSELLEPHQVLLCANFEQAEQYLTAGCIDIALVDIVMPELNGFEVLKLLRQHPSAASAYMILISADRNQLLDRLWAYHLQAQDFVAKPFNIEELVLMLKSKIAYIEQLQRQNSEPPEASSYSLHPEQRLFLTPQGNISLSEMEYRLLERLMVQPGELVSVDDLIQDVWRDRECIHLITASNLRSLVYKVRLKIEPDPSNPVLIVQVRNLGYTFSVKESNIIKK